MNLILREKIIEDFKKKYSREINEKGYLKNIEDNLLDGIELELFEKDFGNLKVHLIEQAQAEEFAYTVKKQMEKSGLINN
jgi:hypothetical protein